MYFSSNRRSSTNRLIDCVTDCSKIILPSETSVELSSTPSYGSFELARTTSNTGSICTIEYKSCQSFGTVRKIIGNVSLSSFNGGNDSNETNSKTSTPSLTISASSLFYSVSVNSADCRSYTEVPSETNLRSNPLFFPSQGRESLSILKSNFVTETNKIMSRDHSSDILEDDWGQFVDVSDIAEDRYLCQRRGRFRISRVE